MGKFDVKDHYYKKAKQENYLARSVYKLEEVDQKYNVVKKGDHAVDFGYHPGSWAQYLSRKVGEQGSVTGIDIRPINKKLLPTKNIKLFEKSIFDVENMGDLDRDSFFDLVVSDMAPNTTGIRSVDQDRSLNLVEMVYHLLPTFLKPGGNFVIKVFDSSDAQKFLRENKKMFAEYYQLKPKSTRSISKEFFAIGKGFKA